MRAILPAQLAAIVQTQVGFVNQRTGLQNVAGAFTSHVAMSHMAQLVIDEGGEFFQSPFVTRTPSPEQFGDFLGL
jgi:hypothetical protein